jgi:hypothetical protein
MLKRLALSICTVLLTVSVTASAGASTHRLVSPAIFAKVLRVHNCEERTWNVNGPTYAGGLGWRIATWSAYRLPWMPSSAALASPEIQARAMLHFVTVAMHGVWPDQNGQCHGY